MDRDIHRGKTTQSSEENEKEARREKNRLAASRCRQNKDKKLQLLKQQNQEIEEENKKLADEKREVKQQVMISKRLVEEHCRRGCKIPEELVHLWNDLNATMAEESSSDEDSGEENKLPGFGVVDEMHVALRSPPNTAEASQQDQAVSSTETSDHVSHQFEAPTALFSGKPLDALQATRSRSNSSSKSASSAPVSPAQVRFRRASSSTNNHFFTSQATAGLPSPLAPVSTRSAKVVQMQVDNTDTSCSSASNIPRTISDMYCYNNNVSAMVVKSQDIMQVQTISALPDIQPISETGARCALLDGPIQTVGTVYEKATMECGNGVAEHPVVNEAASNQNLLSFNSFLETVDGYTYSEELFHNATNKEGGNDKIQGWEAAKTNGGKLFQSQSQSEPTFLFDTVESAEVSPSLLQQTKTSPGSLPEQAAETIADNDVQFADQNKAWPNEMLAPQDEGQSMSSMNHFQSNMLNQRSVTASKQAGSQRETTSSRVRPEGFDQSSRVILNISASNPIKATVLSQEQLFMLKQKQSLGGQNLPSGFSPARNKSATSHQPQQVTWTSGEVNEANSKADNNASDVFVNLYKIKTGAHLVARKNTIAINELSSCKVTDNNNIDGYSQSRLNIPHSGLPNVPHKRTAHPFVPNTAPSHNAITISTQILSNISSDQIAQNSPFQLANGGSRNGHGYSAVETNNNIYISAPACNPPTQHVSQVTGAEETGKIFSPNAALPTNSVCSSTPTPLNTTSPQYCPQMNTISKSRHSSNASNNGSYMCSSSAGNTSAQSDFQNHNTTTSAMTSGGQQYIIDTSLTFPAALVSREIQVSNGRNRRPRNTEASCSNTYTTDQVSITSTSETLLQPTMTISDINSLRVVAPEDFLLMSGTDVPQDTYEHRISVPEDIDYLSESPQAFAQFSL